MSQTHGAPGVCVDCNNPNQSSAVAKPESGKAVTEENPLDAATFVPPIPHPYPSIIIEFCDRCRWLHRATWVQTELFLTFPPPAVQSISLIPRNAPETAGRFRVWLQMSNHIAAILVWDRKVEGGFPELKVLKQRIRDHVDPNKSLGHSDVAM